MKLFVKFLLLLIGVESLLSAVSSDISSNLGVHLVKVLFNVSVSFLELLFGVFGDLTLHHSLLISEETVRSTEETLKSDYFLQETELRIGLLVNTGLSLGFLLFFDGLGNC